MKTTILFLCVFAAALFSQPIDEPGWQCLFNGYDLTGWSVKNLPEDNNKTFWTIKDSCIEANSTSLPDHDYIWLLSENEYNDFTLCLQYQMYKNTTGNSGVQIRSRYDDAAGWLDGPQIDIHPPQHWRTGMMWDETRGNQRWLYPNITKDTWVDSTMAFPGMIYFYNTEGDGWNDLQITATGTNIWVILNGIPISHYSGTGVLDDSLHEAKNVGMNGHIALQIHKGDETKVRFKNIYIKNLNNSGH